MLCRIRIGFSSQSAAIEQGEEFLLENFQSRIIIINRLDSNETGRPIFVVCCSQRRIEVCDTQNETAVSVDPMCGKERAWKKQKAKATKCLLN